MVCLAPRVPGEIVGPRRLSGVVVRPLNFTVRAPVESLTLASLFLLVCCLLLARALTQDAGKCRASVELRH